MEDALSYFKKYREQALTKNMDLAKFVALKNKMNVK
jgi:hypothetical protein